MFFCLNYVFFIKTTFKVLVFLETGFRLISIKTFVAVAAITNFLMIFALFIK